MNKFSYDLEYKKKTIISTWTRVYKENGKTVLESLLKCESVPELKLIRNKRQSKIFLDQELLPIGYWSISLSGTEYKCDIDRRKKKLVAYQNGVVFRDTSFDQLDFITDSNMTSQLAWFYANRAAVDSSKYSFLSTGDFTIFPYEVEKIGKNTKSSFGEDITLDASGIIESIHYPILELVTVKRDHDYPSSTFTEKQIKSIKDKSSFSPKSRKGVISRDGEFKGPFRSIEYTVSVPKNFDKCWGVALFIGGTGEYNRHGITQFDGIHLGYHTLLDGLAQRGLATFRYEKSPKPIDDIKITDYDFDMLCTEATACLMQIRKLWPDLPYVVIGHSLGGVVALRLASEHHFITSVMTLATPGRPIKDVLISQREIMLDRIKISNSSKKQIQAIHNKQLKEGRALVSSSSDTPHDKFISSLVSIDPLNYISKGKTSYIILQGDKDNQVSIEDSKILYEKMKEKKLDSSLFVLKGYNHLMHRQKFLDDFSKDKRKRVPISLIQNIANSLKQITVDENNYEIKFNQ